MLVLNYAQNLDARVANARVLVAEMSIAPKLNEYFGLTQLLLRIEKPWSRLVDKIKSIWCGWTARSKSESDREPAGGDRPGASSAAQPARSGKPIRRILIYRLGSLGDTVVALPCLHKVAEIFPDAERYVLTNVPVSSKAAPLATILANAGLIDGAIPYPVGLRSITKLLALAWRLRGLGASTLIYLSPPRGLISVYRDIAFFLLCGFTRIIGAPTTRDLRLCRVDPATGLTEQECVRLTRTIAELGPIDLDNSASWDLRLTDPERQVGAKTIAVFNGRPFIGINMGGKAAENHWGDDNWRNLLREIARDYGGYGLLVVGAADDAACVAYVTENWPSEVVNACGRLLPRESAAALEEANLFIGHDLGPLHLAAACGVTCVGIYGGLNEPRQWHPYGSQHRIIHRMEGVGSISFKEVATAVRASLPAIAAMRIPS